MITRPKTITGNTTDLDKRLQQLVKEARQGQTKSYRALLETLAPFVRRNSPALLSLYGLADMAEDITQEILLTVHLKLHTYDQDMSFVAWIRTIMKHKIIDLFRRKKLQTFSIDAFENWEIADSENPEIHSIRRDLHSLLGSLKPPAGDVIYALKVEGTTIKDLAATYKMSESNIKVMIHRGLHKLSAMASKMEGGV